MSQIRGAVIAVAALAIGLVLGLFIPFGQVAPASTITKRETIPTTITETQTQISTVTKTETISTSKTTATTTTQVTFRYVGSVDSKIYHYPSCSYVERIKPENEIWFIDENDAKSKGYRPCEVCKPPG